EGIVAVGQIAAERAVDAGEAVSADRAVAGCRAGPAAADRDRHARGRVVVLTLREAVAGDAVVAAVTLERVVQPGSERRRVVGIGLIAAGRAVDAADEGIGADRAIAADR